MAVAQQTQTIELWRRCSAIAIYPGFSSYLEISEERRRFVINATIEHVSEIQKLQEYVDCIASILGLQRPRKSEDEIDGDWAE